PNSKWYDDALYILGVSYYYTKKYGSAERRFREILANYQDSKYADEAKLYLAKTKLALQEEDEAMKIFEEIFKSKVKKAIKSQAALALGTYYNENVNFTMAQKYFLSVRDSLGSKEEKKIAQNFIADDYYNMLRFPKAISAYLQILGMKPTKDEIYRAYYQSAVCSFNIMRIKDGMEYLQKLIDDENYFDSLGALELLQGEGYEIDDDTGQAVVVYKNVTEYEKNKTKAGEAYYRLGLIYQFDYDNLSKAKEYYDKAVELARSSDFGRDALERSSDIGKIKTFTQNSQIDSTATQDVIDDAAYTQYQLAELYWLKLNKPDSAIVEMQYLVDSFPTALSAPEGMIALSQMYREYKKDTIVADSILKSLLVKYPHSDFVPEALKALGWQGTPADTGYAELYLRRAEDFLVDKKNIDSAQVNYQYIVDHFPDSKYYLQARFSLIWLTEQYESPGDSSVYYAYQAFIDSFPDTHWAQEAQKRINYVPARQNNQGQSGADTLLANAGNALNDEFPGQRDTTQDTSTYVDPLVAVYIGPNGKKIPNITYEPIETRDTFIYPTEAYRSAWEGDLYFQILLDFSGEVVDHILKIRSGIDAIDNEASKTVASMTFDPTNIPPQLQSSWFVYKFKVRKPEQLR
ncbi:MAG: tetratricopeptide repeat protein, partial [FCB group bacterium]|nr:tetratricopeptide repeat protein [FCB group bacterium]